MLAVCEKCLSYSLVCELIYKQWSYHKKLQIKFCEREKGIPIVDKDKDLIKRYYTQKNFFLIDTDI